jgi:hypothetical protein
MASSSSQPWASGTSTRDIACLLANGFLDELYGGKMSMCNRIGVAGTIRLFQETGETILVVIVLLSMQQIRPLFAGAAIRRFMWPESYVMCLFVSLIRVTVAIESKIRLDSAHVMISINMPVI